MRESKGSREQLHVLRSKKKHNADKVDAKEARFNRVMKHNFYVVRVN